VYDPRVAAQPPRGRAAPKRRKALKINGLTVASGSVAALLAAGALVLAVDPARADVAAGKARFNAACGQCHDSADFENENPQALANTLRRIVSGELKHKKALQLSDQEIADIAAYMSTGGK
jgi:mono/diheme cytochrome c family protein